MASAPGPIPPEDRTADRALVLALATFVLLTPPAIAIFDVPVSVLGVPLLHIYAFGVWIVAIAVGGALAVRLMRRGMDDPRAGGN
jgi:hypothetical protein